ncbi:GIY-YIG nuclease family protein, partial [Chryseosolibacter indicus]|uniref:GIY-YIG nuclease family protein n=1 Tax=Chryseosolibacter indicus TaxID=2782351 RepID=UPI0020B27FD3
SNILHEGSAIAGPFRLMSYFVYILYGEKCDKYYVGHTDSIERRLEEHNTGRGSTFTSNCHP